MYGKKFVSPKNGRNCHAYLVPLVRVVVGGESRSAAWPGRQRCPPAPPRKSLVWERFDVDLQVNLDGTFDVAEHQSDPIFCGWKPLPSATATFPKRHLASLSEWSVVDAAGNRYTQAEGGRLPYTFVVDDVGSSYTIRWYFPGRPTSPRACALRYRVHDGLRHYAGGGQLWWKAYLCRPAVPAPCLARSPCGGGAAARPRSSRAVGAYLGTAEAGRRGARPSAGQGDPDRPL
jgi:hypothetical protein